MPGQPRKDFPGAVRTEKPFHGEKGKGGQMRNSKQHMPGQPRKDFPGAVRTEKPFHGEKGKGGQMRNSI